jgi:hypothetical protein
MNTTTQDVRDYLCKALVELGNSDASPEEMALIIERAKATSNVAAQYTNLVKAEIDAIRLMDDTGKLPTAVTEPSIAPARPRLVG